MWGGVDCLDSTAKGSLIGFPHKKQATTIGNYWFVVFGFLW